MEVFLLRSLVRPRVFLLATAAIAVATCLFFWDVFGYVQQQRRPHHLGRRQRQQQGAPPAIDSDTLKSFLELRDHPGRGKVGGLEEEEEVCPNCQLNASCYDVKV